MGWKAAFAAFVLIVSTSSALADAPPCKPHLVASLDMLRQANGALAIMVQVNGKPQRMTIGIDDMHSFITADLAKSEGIAEQTVNSRVHIGTEHGQAKTFGTVREFGIGTGIANNVPMIILPPGFDGKGTAGSIGTDILANFDVELDFAANKINFLNGCTGFGGYWAARYAELPLDLETLGRPSATFQLDGQPVTVTFSVDRPGSRMPFNVAFKKFNLTKTSPGMSLIEKGDHEAYEYRFKTLTADGVTISNPLVRIHGAPDAPTCDGHEHFKSGPHRGRGDTVRCTAGGDLQLGLRELTQMHLLFAFPEKKLYLTAAGAH